MIEVSRRGLLGMFAAGAAAAIVRTPGLLMPVKPALIRLTIDDWARFYENRTIRYWLDVQAIRDRNASLAASTYAGGPVVSFRGIPIHVIGRP